MNSKKLKLRPAVKDALGIIAFYLIIIVGVILLDARFEDLNQQKNAEVSKIQSAQINR